jgi:hypothetical protein
MKPNYEMSWRSASTDAVPEALQGCVYWYDTGTEAQGNPVYYDTSDTYAYWAITGIYIVTVIADVDTTPTNYFDAAGIGRGAWSGTLSFSEYTIADAWYRAETSIFESLREFIGGTEGKNCFRGFLPVQGDSDDDKYTNVWQMTSGGSGEFDTTRLTGESGNWCSLRTDVRIESLWETRERAMQFSGMVLAWLKSTGNYEATDNVTWCHLTDIPAEPEEYKTDGKNRKRYWRQTVDMEIVYKTESVY